MPLQNEEVQQAICKKTILRTNSSPLPANQCWRCWISFYKRWQGCILPVGELYETMRISRLIWDFTRFFFLRFRSGVASSCAFHCRCSCCCRFAGSTAQSLRWAFCMGSDDKCRTKFIRAKILGSLPLFPIIFVNVKNGCISNSSCLQQYSNTTATFHFRDYERKSHSQW